MPGRVGGEVLMDHLMNCHGEWTVALQGLSWLGAMGVPGLAWYGSIWLGKKREPTPEPGHGIGVRTACHLEEK